MTKTDAGTQEDSAAMEMESRGRYTRPWGSEVRPTLRSGVAGNEVSKEVHEFTLARKAAKEY